MAKLHRLSSDHAADRCVEFRIAEVQLRGVHVGARLLDLSGRGARFGAGIGHLLGRGARGVDLSLPLDHQRLCLRDLLLT